MTKDERQSGGSRFLGDLEPQKQEWVGLTEEEKHECYLKIDIWSRCVEAVEAKLKEKNGG